MAGRCQAAVTPSLNSSFERLDEKGIANYVSNVSKILKYNLHRLKNTKIK